MLLVGVEVVLVALALLLLVPVVVFSLQVLLSLPAMRPQTFPAGRRPTVCVLVPAHDEAEVIATTLRSVRAQLAPGDRVLVVADNCSDDTARIARAEGAEVIERTDLSRRGKGYALDFGVCHLEQVPPEIVVIVDADCELHDGALDRLARRSAEQGCPVQALYLMHSPQGARLKTRVGEFAWSVRNKLRPLGYHRLGLPCQLMGTGMAFPWPVIRGAALANGHIVEDLKLGLELARTGTPPLFCPDAVVTSVFPASTEGTRTQRTRWEHGHLSMIFSDGIGFLAAALARFQLRQVAMLLDLCVPPLALLVLLVSTLLAIDVAAYAVLELARPLGLALFACLVLGISVLLAWFACGRRILSLRDLSYAPFYALGKIPLYVRFLVGRQVEWVRSRRDG